MWAAYRVKRGSLNAGLRTEVAVARLCAVFANYQRTKESDKLFHLEDFAPHIDPREMTLEEIAAQMGAL